MTGIKRTFRFVAVGVVAASAWTWSTARPAHAQGAAIAYEPVVNWYLNGAALTATPVVSADRRYVRMTLNPYFNTVNGFTTYSAQVGAVSGGGVVGGGAGGFGGGGAGGFAGMNGAVGGMNGAAGGGGATGFPTGPPLTVNNASYLAGDFATQVAQPGAGFIAGPDPFDQAASSAGRNVTSGNRQFPGQAAVAGQAMRRFPGQAAVAGDGMRPVPAEWPAFADNPGNPAPGRARATASRRKATRKSTRRPATTARRDP
ncbi:MAG: hypothetical protein ACYC61_01880 [Isosphaeraceae bacterium]